ncbi:N-acetylglucosamine-binding protein GbpA [Pseudomonas kermanshahensis]|uniref:N-acetylglucosamine-binding protein GbpA n=1 Tax=Pseudomonas kermanshahensis TaxID=2745482 RepID=UPI0023DC7506|nr:N-acetylglucosamine-binding protein GbpA [Pseudomonas kermanshahensis]WEL55258.1 N-acetylglucosamine-binding protein GbpA [Pseudomonas kermanshahensis]
MRKGSKLRKFAVSGVWVAVVGAVLQAQLANAHGYTNDPPSRAYACRLGLNSGCGGAAYEPQSVGEAPKGFPQLGPVDGKIASGAHINFLLLDEQTAGRWHLTPIRDRKVAFDWYYEVGHKTTKWEYFITKANWNPNAALSREAFESTPFCEVDGQGIPARGEGQPMNGQALEKHQCTLPADRSGHHVILGLWTIDDTAFAFHDVMDVDIQAEAGPPPEWPKVGSINPNRDLQVGDKVKARAFVNASESAQYSVSVDIDNAEEAQAQNWSYKLAKRISETQTRVKAGQMDEAGNIKPVQGNNTIYAKPETGITGYQLDFEGMPGDESYMHLDDLKPDYTLTDGKTTLDFTVTTNRKLQLTTRLLDAANQQVGFVRQDVDATASPVTVPVESTAGEHVLKVVGVNKSGRVLLQQERKVQLKDAGNGAYDFEFPQSVASYKAGTRVLQPKTGDVFECKPFPFEGWCKIYSESASQYEPGLGSNWQDAWIKH